MLSKCGAIFFSECDKNELWYSSGDSEGDNATVFPEVSELSQYLGVE